MKQIRFVLSIYTTVNLAEKLISRKFIRDLCRAVIREMGAGVAAICRDRRYVRLPTTTNNTTATYLIREINTNVTYSQTLGIYLR